VAVYHEKLVRSIIGDEVYEALNKSIVKLNTKSVVDITELHDALKIAPKSVVAFLMQNLSEMKKDDAKEISLPWDKNASMLINKMDSDVFKGHISKDGKIIHEFDLCSIPQLAAHMLSLFELYDESPAAQPEIVTEPEKESQDINNIKSQLQALESKINALIVMAAGQNSPSQPVKKSQKDSLVKALKNLQKTDLKKAGMANTMPKPPRPGVHSGSQKGIAQSGFHGPKTANSDFSAKGGQSQTSLSPHLKSGDKLAAQNGLPQQPKQPKQIKSSFTMKSEHADSKCLDCGQPDFVAGKFQKCACFKVLSDPTIKKNENGSLTFTLADDWDDDNAIALWNSLRKNRK
jgi:hypothetical protein